MEKIIFAKPYVFLFQRSFLFLKEKPFLIKLFSEASRRKCEYVYAKTNRRTFGASCCFASYNIAFQTSPTKSLFSAFYHCIAAKSPDKHFIAFLQLTLELVRYCQFNSRIILQIHELNVIRDECYNLHGLLLYHRHIHLCVAGIDNTFLHISEDAARN